MDFRRPGQSPSTLANVPDDYRAIGARYADPRGRTNAMAGLGPSVPSPVESLYPGTAKLRGGLLASLITSPELDANYVQRFQNIAIIAQLADTILAVARATGKCIVPLDFDPNEYASPEDCSCDRCTRKRKIAAASKSKETFNKGKGKGEETEVGTSVGLNMEGTVGADVIGDVSVSLTSVGADAVAVVENGSLSLDAGAVRDAEDPLASVAKVDTSGSPPAKTTEVLVDGYPPPVDVDASSSKNAYLEGTKDDQESIQQEEGDIWNVE